MARELIKCDGASLSTLCHNLSGVIAPDEVKTSVLILIQHECIDATSEFLLKKNSNSNQNQQPVTSVAGLEYVYRIHVGAVINRLRFPSLLFLVRSFYGDIGVRMMEYLIENGRGNYAHICADAVLNKGGTQGMELHPDTLSNALNEEDIPVQQQSDYMEDRVRSSIRSTFELMVRNQFIDIVPQLVVSPSSEPHAGKDSADNDGTLTDASLFEENGPTVGGNNSLSGSVTLSQAADGKDSKPR